MPTFRSKEIVDARQFDGSSDKAKELVKWVKSRSIEYRNSTLSVSRSTHELGSSDPAIVIPTPCLLMHFGEEPKDWRSLTLYPTDWLVERQDGRLQVESDLNMKNNYEQV